MRNKIFTVLFLCLALVFAGCNGGQPSAPDVQRVGFDIDDTLLFSTPAFDSAKETYQFGSDQFWGLVNASDREYSVVKKKVEKIVKNYMAQGVEVYAITARPGTNGEPLKIFMEDAFGIPRENVFFEPNGKTERIKALKLDIYYGDSDSDIEDAIAAGIKGVRIQRSQKSSYKNSDGTLRKYNPGKYGEEIIPDSEE